MCSCHACHFKEYSRYWNVIFLHAKVAACNLDLHLREVGNLLFVWTIFTSYAVFHAYYVLLTQGKNGTNLNVPTINRRKSWFLDVISCIVSSDYFLMFGNLIPATMCHKDKFRTDFLNQLGFVFCEESNDFTAQKGFSFYFNQWEYLTVSSMHSYMCRIQ